MFDQLQVLEAEEARGYRSGQTAELLSAVKVNLSGAVVRLSNFLWSFGGLSALSTVGWSVHVALDGPGSAHHNVGVAFVISFISNRKVVHLQYETVLGTVE
jgi:hypothetical protein